MKLSMKRLQVNESGFSSSPSDNVVVLRSLHRVDAAFCLAAATPSTRACIFIGRRPAGARHTPNRQESRCDQWMRRKFRELEDRLDLLARDIGEGIEFQPRVVGLDDGNSGAQPALEAL